MSSGHSNGPVRRSRGRGTDPSGNRGRGRDGPSGTRGRGRGGRRLLSIEMVPPGEYDA